MKSLNIVHDEWRQQLIDLLVKSNHKKFLIVFPSWQEVYNSSLITFFVKKFHYLHFFCAKRCKGKIKG